MVISMIILTGASVTAGLVMVNITLLPILFRYNKTFQRKMIFSNCINYPANVDYDNPSHYNLVNCHNFKIKYIARPLGEDVEIGVWFLMPTPKSLKPLDLSTKEFLKNELKHCKNPIILYCHGNSNHRASPERLCLYKMFQRLNFVVITFDYRGYGDSVSLQPTEEGVVDDTLHVFAWLRSCVADEPPPILLWGHSLGSAIASNLSTHLELLCEKYNMEDLAPPDGLVLEAPFNNLQEGVTYHPYSKLVSWLPYFKRTILNPIAASDEFSFATDRYLSNCYDIPILILHSEYDKIVPISLALKLHSVIKESRLRKGYDTPLQLHIFPKIMRLGHNNIHLAANLPDVLLHFLKQIPHLNSYDFEESLVRFQQCINSCKKHCCHHCRLQKRK